MITKLATTLSASRPLCDKRGHDQGAGRGKSPIANRAPRLGLGTGWWGGKAGLSHGNLRKGRSRYDSTCAKLAQRDQPPLYFCATSVSPRGGAQIFSGAAKSRNEDQTGGEKRDHVAGDAVETCGNCLTQKPKMIERCSGRTEFQGQEGEEEKKNQMVGMSGETGSSKRRALTWGLACWVGAAPTPRL